MKKQGESAKAEDAESEENKTNVEIRNRKTSKIEGVDEESDLLSKKRRMKR